MAWSRRHVLIGVAVAVVLGGVGVALVARGSQPSPPAQQRAVVHTGAEAAEQPNVAAVTRLLTGLPAAFAAGRKDGLSASAAKHFADVRKALPPGSTVEIHPDTWRRAETVGTVAVTITAPRSAPQAFIVVLSQEAAGWKVVSTQAAPGPG
jgi:hypothetical protein